MNYQQFLKTIRVLPEKPVYVLIGEEDYLIGITADTIFSRKQKKEAGNVERHRFSADTATANHALSVIESPGFFSSSAVVMFQGIESCKEKDVTAISEYIKRPNPASTLILTCRSIDKRKSLYKHLQKSDTAIIEFKNIREEHMASWINAVAEQKGKRISPRAVEHIIQNVGGHLGVAAMEVKKLVCYVGEENTIEQHHVEELVGRSRVDSAFDLSNAIADRDGERALSILGGLLSEGESEIGIVALLRWQILRILRGKDLERNGMPRNKVPSALGVNFFEQEFIRVLGRFDYPSARKAYLALHDSDIALRGSMFDKRFILEKLVINLCFV